MLTLSAQRSCAVEALLRYNCHAYPALDPIARMYGYMEELSRIGIPYSFAAAGHVIQHAPSTPNLLSSWIWRIWRVLGRAGKSLPDFLDSSLDACSSSRDPILRSHSVSDVGRVVVQTASKRTRMRVEPRPTPESWGSSFAVISDICPVDGMLAA